MPDTSRTRFGSASVPLPSSRPPSPAAVEAYTVAATLWRADLVRFVANMLHGDVHRANDLVQDALLAAWRHLGGLRDPKHLRAWLYRTSYRNAISSIRRRGPRGTSIVALDAGVEEPAAANPTRDVRRFPIADGWADSEDLVPRLQEVLPGLPPRYEQAIRMHYLENLGLREVANVLGVAVPTLKMRLHRGRALLKHRLLAEETRRRARAAPGGRGATLGLPPPPPPPGSGRTGPRVEPPTPTASRPAPGTSS